MNLHKLAIDNVESLLDSQIYCYGYSPVSMEELTERFPISGKIEAVIDDNVRNWGNLSVGGRIVDVSGNIHLQEVNLDRTVFLIVDDYWQEAYERLVKILDGIGYQQDIYYYESRENAIAMEYRRRYEGKELEDIIIFRSGPHASAYVKGMDFADNARALYEYMLDNRFNERYRLVWLVKNPSEFVRHADIPNTCFLPFDWSISENKEERDAYYEALCLARYIFFTDAYGFARNCRPDQVRVQLWHGCGFKTRVNFVRCEKRYEYTTVISQVYSRIHQDIYGLREEQMLITGYAKQDWLFHPVKWALEELGIPKAGRYIFWLPTFRMAGEGMQNLNEYEFHNQTGLPVVDTEEKMEKLNALLRERDIVLVIKLHPFQDRGKIRGEARNHIVLLDNEQLAEKDIQINQLLGYADALVSDYSSAAVDYMLLDRPIGFTLDDMEEYSRSRGFVFGNIREWLPGKELFTFEDFCAFCREIGERIDSSEKKRRRLRDRMHQYKDDNNCRRIVEALKIKV